MGKGRLEAFSDGVMAIIITIMVLELKVPEGADWAALRPLTPVFLSYVLSFVFLGIYWNNHHHLLHAVAAYQRSSPVGEHASVVLAVADAGRDRLDGGHHFAAAPVAVYGVVQLLAALAYFILTRSLIAAHGNDSPLAAAVGRDFKGKVSVVIWAVAILVSFLTPLLACALYVLVAIIWFVPDRRIERALAEAGR